MQADTAERGYRPDPVEPGTWNVDLGVAAVPERAPATTVTVRCLATAVGPAFVRHPVDPTHVARHEPGWYDGDLHLHAYHSNPKGLAGPAMVAAAGPPASTSCRSPSTSRNQHWRELGPGAGGQPRPA